jgi:hypothetical protein
MSKPCNNLKPNPLPPGVNPVFRKSGKPVYNSNICLPPPVLPSPPPPPPPLPPLEPCMGNLKRNINGVCGCPPGQIAFQGILCVPKCTDGKINKGPMGACGCPDNFEQVDGIGPCVPKCNSTEERINGKCVPKCSDGMERIDGECKCPGNFIQKNGVGPCVPPEPEPEPEPEPVPTVPMAVTPIEINKIIASLLRSLSFTGNEIGSRLEHLLGKIKLRGQPLNKEVENNFIFKKVFKLTNKPSWTNAINKFDIEEKFKAIESEKLDPKNKNAESNLANYILQKYIESRIANPEKNFIKLFFDLIYTVRSIYKVDLLNVYSSYFKVFIKNNVLKVLSKDCKKGIDPYDCIFEKLKEHGTQPPLKSRGGRRKTIKHRKSKSNKKTKKNRHN